MAALSVAADGARARAGATAPQPRKLRVGVFADSRLQPRWAAQAFAKLAAAGFAEVVLVECGGAPAGTPALPWRLYSRVDRWAFGGGDPGERVDLASLLPVDAGPASGPARDLDVAFALGGVDDTRLDGLARYGVWRFHFFGPEEEAGAGEVARGEPLTGSGLRVRLVPGGPERLAYQSWSRTYPYSVARNREQLLEKASEFVVRGLRELHRSGFPWLEQCRVVRDGPEKNAAAPSILPIAGKLVKRGWEKATAIEQWGLAFRFGRGAPEAVPADLAGFTRILPPKDRDWADPFAVEKDGRHFVFFEELPYAAGKAHISMIEVRRDGTWSAPVKVLERDYHLSYPFLFEDEGRLYMVPETARGRTVELWRCESFPDKWRLERTLLEGVRCVDATLHRAVDGRWWMFANAAAGESRSFDDELHLYYADRLDGEWLPHARNPVKSDARSARPAGALYWKNGSLVRPAQVCVPRYGAGLSLQRIVRLTPREYAERQVERVLPAAPLLGLHTVNRAGALTVVDVFARRRRV